MFERITTYVKSYAGPMVIVSVLGFVTASIAYGLMTGSLDHFAAFAGKGRS
jgi:hypothetical protein